MLNVLMVIVVLSGDLSSAIPMAYKFDTEAKCKAALEEVPKLLASDFPKDFVFTASCVKPKPLHSKGV